MNCSFGITRKDRTMERFDLLTIEERRAQSFYLLVLLLHYIFTISENWKTNQSFYMKVFRGVTSHAVYFWKRKIWAVEWKSTQSEGKPVCFLSEKCQQMLDGISSNQLPTLRLPQYGSTKGQNSATGHINLCIRLNFVLHDYCSHYLMQSTNIEPWPWDSQ